MDPSIKSKETRLISLSVLKAAQKPVLGYLSIKRAACLTISEQFSHTLNETTFHPYHNNLVIVDKLDGRQH